MTDPNTTVSPNMSLPVPNLADPGPSYAQNVNDSLNIIDGHRHTGAPTDGLQLDLSTQLCAGDVQLNGHNLGTTRSVEFQSQPGQLVGSQDVNCLYVNAGVLGFNNSSGLFTPLTGAVSAQFTNFNVASITTDHTILATDAFNLFAINGAGTIHVTLPRSSTILPAAVGRLYVFVDVSGNANNTSHLITLQVTVGSGDVFAGAGSFPININTAFGVVALYTDGAGTWFVWGGNQVNVGETLSINAGTLSFTNGTLAGNAAMSGFTLTGSAAGSFVLTGGATFDTGGKLAVTTAGSVALDAPMKASTGNTFSLGQANISPGTSGTYTLANTEYNCPIINPGAITLSGDLTLAFPSKPGTEWTLLFGTVTLAGHLLKVSIGSGGGIAMTGPNVVKIICYAANQAIFMQA